MGPPGKALRGAGLLLEMVSLGQAGYQREDEGLRAQPAWARWLVELLCLEPWEEVAGRSAEVPAGEGSRQEYQSYPSPSPAQPDTALSSLCLDIAACEVG